MIYFKKHSPELIHVRIKINSNCKYDHTDHLPFPLSFHIHHTLKTKHKTKQNKTNENNTTKKKQKQKQKTACFLHYLKNFSGISYLF